MKSGAAELLAPAGNFETALAAFNAGADAVYCGLSNFSARAFADNFSFDDLRNLVRFARARDKKVYVTFNTVIDECDIADAIGQLARLAELAPDAIIVQDLGVARMCSRHFPELQLHASTQLVAHNLEGVLALRELGFRRVVLARELSLDEIASIAKRCGDIELEVFIHGALCYSISGLCLFGAMEKGRSGNRGKCPYCCRVPYENDEGGKTLAFSMKDLRLGEDVRRLVDAGVASLKIEGRMKSALYVASVTRYYRDILRSGADDVRRADRVTVADLETVFSRRTTELYFNGSKNAPSPIDPSSLGHLGTEIGTVKRVTKDRDGFAWLRFHTARALERHDGLQFEAMVDGRHVGMGIGEMRQAIARRSVFEVAAGEDVEILLTDDVASVLKPEMKIYCSMSNAVKRKFPVPSFRSGECEGGTTVDVEVVVTPDRLSAKAEGNGVSCTIGITGNFAAAKNPEKTYAAVEKAFSKLGGTDYRLGRLSVVDASRLFVPMSVLNDLRRDLVEKLDGTRERVRAERIAKAVDDDAIGPEALPNLPRRVLKIRAGQDVPNGEWDEIVVAVGAATAVDDLPRIACERLRLALPVYTAEPEFNRLRVAVKRLLRAGFKKWEASDLATLRLLKQVGVTDITADWTLYAFNSRALAALAGEGVRRFVASPENTRENVRALVESGFAVEVLAQQSTPLFISLTQPQPQSAYGVFRRDGLWVTTKSLPRTFDVPKDAIVRHDLSWDLE